MIVPPAFYSAISNHLAENYSSSAYPKLRIDLKRHTDGEKDEDELASESTQEAKGAGVREGTARLLRRFRSSIKVSGDSKMPSVLNLIPSPTLCCCRVMSRPHQVSSSRASWTSTELRRTAYSLHCSTSPSRPSRRVSWPLTIRI